MLATVLTKTTRDRWRAMAIGMGVLILLFLSGMAVYRDIDLSVYTGLPEAFRSLVNIPADADVGSLAYGAIYTSYGALTLAALSVSMGTASVAGEERAGTMGILLGNPKSRTYVLVSKAANLVLLTAAGAAVLWIGGLAVPAMLGVEVVGIHVGALVLHMFVIAVFHGFLAMAVGAWTGKTRLASGVAAAVMVISFFAVGLLPLVEGLENGAKAFPWYYFSGSQPHLNGADWGHLTVLLTGIVVLAAASVVGVNRRDLRSQHLGDGLIDRLRSHQLTRRVVERLAGATRVSAIWVKTASDHQAILIVVAVSMFGMMGLMLGPMYAAVDEALITLSDAFPEELLALFGGGDLTTPEGWYQLETFSMMVPIALMVVTVLIGSKGLAGEESRNTMGLLLANPIRRSTVVLQKTLAMTVHAFAVGFATFAGVALGSIAADLGMSIPNIAAASMLGTLLGLVFGALALAISAATGRARMAAYTTIGVALVLFVANGFLPFNESLDWLTSWLPFHYYLSSDPLMNGMNWAHGGVLAAAFAVLLGAALVLFERRDLRQTG